MNVLQGRHSAAFFIPSQFRIICIICFDYVNKAFGVSVRLTSWLGGQVRGGFFYWRGNVVGVGQRGAFGVGQRVRYTIKYFVKRVEVEKFGGADCYARTQAASLSGLVQGLSSDAKGGGACGAAGKSAIEGGKNIYVSKSLVNPARFRLVIDRRGMWAQMPIRFNSFLGGDRSKDQLNKSISNAF